MKRRHTVIITVALAVATLVAGSSGTVIAQSQGSTISVEVNANDTVSAGGQVEVTVNSTDTGSVTVEGIPSDWTVSSSQNDDAFVAPTGSGNSIEKDGLVLWAWADDQFAVNVSVLLAVPDAVEPGEYEFTVVAESGDGNSTEGSTAVMVESTSTSEDSRRGENTSGKDDQNDAFGGSNEDVTNDTEGSDGSTDENNDTDGSGSQALPGFTLIVALIAIVSGVIITRLRSW